VSFRLIRTLRTPSSERFLLQSEVDSDGAALDLHYLANGNVVGTLVVLDASLQSDEMMQKLLQFIDESLLPMASLNERNLTFTVVQGNVVGQFDNEK
jgi:hypothetical protein